MGPKMKIFMQHFQRLLAATSLSALLSLSAVQAGEPGVMHISDAGDSAAELVVRGNFADDVCWDAQCAGDDLGEWWHNESLQYLANNRRVSCKLGRWFRMQSRRYLARNRCETQTFDDYLKCKWGYFMPSGGAGGSGPFVGTYERVYAVDPYYADSRDGNVYASQATGVPMAVPLAPTVNHTYNYGWGVPSSRLTPVSRIVP